MGVNVVKLEDVCEFYRGLTYSKKDEATFSDNIVLRASNIDLDTSTLILDDLKYLKEDFVIPNDKKLQKDCIFICMSSGSKSHLGKVAYIDRDYNYAFGGFMGLIKPKTNILPRYLFYLLQTPEYKELIKKLSNGININNIKFSDLKEFQFELPSLEEQEKILNILDKADEIRAKKKLANDKLDEFLKSTFISKFGDPVMNNKQFPTANISEIGVVVTGNTPSRKVEEYYGDYIEWIKSDNINTPYTYLTQATEYLSEEGSNVGRIVPSNSVLVTCIAGSFDCVGNIALTNRSVAFNQQINAIIPNNDLVNSKFLYTQLHVGKKLIQDKSTKSMKGMVSKGKFETIEVIVPDLSEQQHFVKIFNNIEEQKQRNEKVIEQMDNLFNSLSQKAFKGDL